MRVGSRPPMDELLRLGSSNGSGRRSMFRAGV